MGRAYRTQQNYLVYSLRIEILGYDMGRGADSSIFDFKKSISTICNKPVGVCFKIKSQIPNLATNHGFHFMIIKKLESFEFTERGMSSLWSSLRVKMGRAYRTPLIFSIARGLKSWVTIWVEALPL